MMSKSLRLRAECSARNETIILVLTDRSAHRITGLTPFVQFVNILRLYLMCKLKFALSV